LVLKILEADILRLNKTSVSRETLLNSSQSTNYYVCMTRLKLLMVSRLSVLCWENHTQHRKVRTPLSQLRAPLPHSRVPQRRLFILRHTTRHPPLHIPCASTGYVSKLFLITSISCFPSALCCGPAPAPGGGSIDISSHAPCARAPAGTAATAPPTAHSCPCSRAPMPIKKEKTSAHVSSSSQTHAPACNT
jgi:hypothetical protein